ncbi:hypothetical protein EB169_05275 [archaeon]|nr:hypothetical protein [archaeon]
MFRALLDDEEIVTADQRKDLLFKNRKSELYDEKIGLVYYNYQDNAKLRDTKQTYLFKFEEPAE